MARYRDHYEGEAGFYALTRWIDLDNQGYESPAQYHPQIFGATPERMTPQPNPAGTTLTESPVRPLVVPVNLWKPDCTLVGL